MIETSFLNVKVNLFLIIIFNWMINWKLEEASLKFRQFYY